MDYELIRSGRKTLAVEVREGRLIVRAPQRATQREIDDFLRQHHVWIERHLAAAQARQAALAQCERLTPDGLRALAEQAARVLPERVAYYAPLVGVTYGRITIRRQRSRWGSCSAKGDLSFNCLLMLMPPEVADSVVVHELCHRREMNHSPRFYAEVLRVFPDYRRCARWLKENGARLMAMAAPSEGADGA